MKRILALACLTMIIAAQAYLLKVHRVKYIYILANYECVRLIKFYKWIGIDIDQFDEKKPLSLSNPFLLALNDKNTKAIQTLIAANLNINILSDHNLDASIFHEIMSLILNGSISRKDAFALPTIGPKLQQEYEAQINTDMLNGISHITTLPIQDDKHRYPIAYNASVIKFQNEYLMLYRATKTSTSLNMSPVSIIALSKLNKKLSYIDKFSQKINLPSINNDEIDDPKDARVFKLHDKLYVLCNLNFSNTIRAKLKLNGKTIMSPARGMVIAELKNKNNEWHLASPQILKQSYMDSPNEEKNWSPLVHNGKLYLIYSLSPDLIVFEANIENGECKLVSHTKNNLFKKQYGHLRGGTPFIPINDKQYISFAHITQYMASNNPRAYYMMPVIVTIDEDKHFTLSHITPSPILSTVIPRNHDYYAQVIFPSGLFEENGEYKVSIGVNDQDTYLLSIDKERLLRDLKK